MGKLFCFNSSPVPIRIGVKCTLRTEQLSNSNGQITSIRLSILIQHNRTKLHAPKIQAGSPACTSSDSGRFSCDSPEYGNYFCNRRRTFGRNYFHPNAGSPSQATQYLYDAHRRVVDRYVVPYRINGYIDTDWPITNNAASNVGQQPLRLFRRLACTIKCGNPGKKHSHTRVASTKSSKQLFLLQFFPSICVAWGDR